MKIRKSSRHAKIAGDFGESLALYWLSKYGFECALVDHTGIDIIANNPHTKEIMGISVKTRSRAYGTESDEVSIANGDFEKVRAACRAFGCVPYFSIIVDAGAVIRGYVLSLEHLLEICPMSKRTCNWKMKERDLSRYEQDPEIKSFKFHTTIGRWWEDTSDE
jgi:Holliday junction resolvase-like predicted endonuclease